MNSSKSLIVPISRVLGRSEEEQEDSVKSNSVALIILYFLSSGFSMECFMSDSESGSDRMEESSGVWWCVSAVKMIVESIKIIACNKVVFASIMLLTALPLSTLLISQSIYTHSLNSQIHHLEALARFAPTRFEARHVWHQSRHDALSLLRIKALFSLPSYLLSLTAALSSVHSTRLALHATATATPSLLSAALRLFATTIFVYVILFAFSPLPRFLAALAPSTTARILLLAAGSALEIYLMAVMNVALVVSVAEERFGWDAIRVGSGLMEGSRVCGWALSGLFVLGSSLIGSKMELLMEGEDWMKVEDKASVIVWYGMLVLWSYVIMTVFYSDCRKRHPIREPQPDELQLSVT
ncbi:unnamed protein product [Sphenostylis stenocarpa]|uniref:Transmembrane protein n=1 Tax=Sphenostylis stenocarpa TaxID=92480 RepID=A0AA86S8C1_9FABA|nr:unnamed protein product [Sphenostylis stenocarpa]